MRPLARLVICSLLLIVCAVSAYADTVSLSGNVNFDNTYATFSSPYSTGLDTQYFSAFSFGTVQYFLGTIPYMVGVLGGTQETFSITDASGDVLAYYNQSNSPSKSYDANGNLVVTLDESGYYTINGGQKQDGYFNLTLDGTSPSGAASNVAFQATGGLDTPTVASAGLAPEPSSVLLLGSGLFLGALLVRTRSRRTLACPS